MVTHSADPDRGIIDLYAGDYDHYEDEKRQRYEALVNAAKNQQREIESAEAFIRRFRAKNTKAKQVQQKIRKLERTERIDAPTLERKTIKFRFPQPPRTGRVVAALTHVRTAHLRTVVYKRLDLAVERGEKIALVGPNGAGKSTLLKLLAGVIEPDGGSVKLGHNVRREYFAQHQLEVLHSGRTVLKTMEEAAAPSGRLPEVRGYLGTFLFGEDDVTKKVGVLSGGEQARLALARMLIDPAGLLLLEEPTNHLDIASREVLEEALRQYTGTLLFASQDRRFIDAVATRVVEMEHGVLTDYPGNYSYYEWKRAQDSIQARADSARGGLSGGWGASGGDLRPGGAESQALRDERKERKRKEAELRAELYRVGRPLSDRVSAIESAIERLENVLSLLEAELADPTLYTTALARAAEKGEQLKDGRKKIAEQMKQWEAATLAAEQGEAQVRGRYGADEAQ